MSFSLTMQSKTNLEMMRNLRSKLVPSISVIDAIRVANDVFGFWNGSLGDL